MTETISFEIPSIERLKECVDGKCTQIILELTEVCNLRCGYCIYNSHHPNYRSFGSKNMPLDIAKKSLDIILKDFQEDGIFLTFYGGEPLANFSLMKQSIEYVRIEYSDIKIGIAFTTNLTLLTRKMIEYLTIWQIQILKLILCVA